MLATHPSALGWRRGRCKEDGGRRAVFKSEQTSRGSGVLPLAVGSYGLEQPCKHVLSSVSQLSAEDEDAGGGKLE